MKQADRESLKQDWWVYPLFVVVVVLLILFV